MYIMIARKCKEKNKDVKKSFMTCVYVIRNFRMYLCYRLGGVAFQAITMFWK